MDEAETSAEAAVVRAAISNRYLSAEQLREALLLREEFARLGHRVGLLQLLRQRHLPPQALPELTQIYQQVLAGLDAQPTTYGPVPSGLAPQAIARARLLLQGHPAQDPPRVKVFINRVGIALGYADSDSGRLSQASEGSAPLVAKRPDSGRLIPGSARLSRDSAHSAAGSGRLVPDSGRLIPHTAEVPAHGGFVRQHVDSDSGRLIPHTAEVPAQPGLPDVDQNAATMAASALQRFGRYLVETELARGGMGVVYKAKDPHLERYVALKVMQGDGFDLDPTDVERFVREAKATAKMRHPNIVSVLDTGTAHGYPYLVMDLVQGESLAQRIKRGGPLDWPEAARLAAGVARALDYSHQQGVLHRDVKPSNILLEPDQGTPLLTDFGLARNAKEEDGVQLTGTGQAVGTPSYMAPEQATGEKELLGPPTDVYGLGATLYHMLAGHPPFRGGTISVMHAVVAEAPKPLRELREGVPPELDAICMRCLAKEPTSRFVSAGELAAALEAVVKGDGQSATERPTRPAPRPPRDRSEGSSERSSGQWGRFALMGLSVLGLVLLGASYAYVSRAEARLGEVGGSFEVLDSSRIRLAKKYLRELAKDPDARPEWEGYGSSEAGLKEALPWQFAAGVEVAPKLPASRVVTAVALGLQDRFDEADELLGNGVEALLLRAELLGQAGRHAEGVELLEPAGRSAPVVEKRLRLLCDGQAYAEAVVEAQSNLPKDSPIRRAVEAEAEAVAWIDLEARLRALDSLLTDAPFAGFRLRSYVLRAQGLIESDRFDEALDEIERLKAARPESAVVCFLRYRIESIKGDFPTARRWLEESLERERNPGFLREQRFQWVIMLHASGDEQRAREELQRLNAVPDPPRVSAAPVARAHFVTGDPERGIELAMAGFDDPRSTSGVRYACLTLVLLGLQQLERWEDARAVVQQVREAASRKGEVIPKGVDGIMSEVHARANQALEGE